MIYLAIFGVYLLGGVALVARERRKTPTVAVYSTRSLASSAFLVLIWPVRSIIAAQERRQGLKSTTRFHVLGKSGEPEYFENWTDAVACAARKAAADSSDATVYDYATLVPNPFDMGRIGPAMFFVDAKGAVDRAKRPFSS